MEETHIPPLLTWRDLLRERISHARERQRLASALGVTPTTLMRWATGAVTPRSESLKQLAAASPEIAGALWEDDGQHNHPLERAAPDERGLAIPVGFYAEILGLRAKTPLLIRSWSMCQRILAHITTTLDPLASGLTAALVTCTPPRTELAVRSLRLVMGKRTSSTSEKVQDLPIYLLGAESLAGSAISKGHLVTSQDLDEKNYFGANFDEGGSGVACPIESGNRTAGCLNISSSIPHFFRPVHLDLIVAYTHLLALAFGEESFYEPERIRLTWMPAQEIQATAFASFRQRVMQLMRESRELHRSLTMAQAETVVCQQLEEELHQHVLSTYHSTDKERLPDPYKVSRTVWHGQPVRVWQERGSLCEPLN